MTRSQHAGNVEVQELIEVSSVAGADVLLNQGSGGNASQKSRCGSKIRIKASGYRLGDVTADSGWVALDLPELRRIVADPDLRNAPAVEAHELSIRRIQQTVCGGTLRPSLETAFHAALDRVVLHTHPVWLNAYTCQEQGQQRLEALLTDAGFAWTRYATPGFALALAVESAVTSYRQTHDREPAIIILENHGLIVTAADARDALHRTRQLEDRLTRDLGGIPDAWLRGGASSPAGVAWSDDLRRAWAAHGHPGMSARPVRWRVLQDAGPKTPLGSGALLPDDVVFGLHDIPAAASSAASWLEGRGTLPRRGIVQVAGAGFVLWGRNDRMVEAVEDNLLAHVLIQRLIARQQGTPRFLAEDDVARLAGMESEAYRLAVVESSQSEARRTGEER